MSRLGGIIGRVKKRESGGCAVRGLREKLGEFGKREKGKMREWKKGKNWRSWKRIDG